MNTELKSRRIVSSSAAKTLALGSTIGGSLIGGETIELISDVGGGKTTFVKGLAKGAGSSDLVHSPSFTLSNEYTGRTLKLLHFDFYRLADPGIMSRAIEEALYDSKSVVIVEWADIIKDVLPEQKLTVHLKALDEQSREIIINYPNNLGYLVPNDLKTD